MDEIPDLHPCPVRSLGEAVSPAMIASSIDTTSPGHVDKHNDPRVRQGGEMELSSMAKRWVGRVPLDLTINDDGWS